MESRIVDLEIRITHLESTLQALDDVVIAQQRTIDRLNAQLGALREQMTVLAQSVPEAMRPEPPPPHY